VSEPGLSIAVGPAQVPSLADMVGDGPAKPSRAVFPIVHTSYDFYEDLLDD
jgi:hypothetical protein